MATALGADVTLCAPFGGEVGAVLHHLIERQGIDVRSVSMQTSNAAMIIDRGKAAGAHRTFLDNAPPHLGRHEIDDLYTTALGAAVGADVCVVAGNQNARVVPPDSFRRLVADLTSSRVPVIIDLSAESLKAALAGGPSLVKISHEELLRDGFTDANDEVGVLRGIDALRTCGAHDVIVSRANAPALIASDESRWRVVTPPLQVVEDRGAGDSMTSGLAVAFARGLAFPDPAARLAAAAAAVSVTRHGFATGHAQTIEALAERVELEEIR
jgi:1-phosphofructokinase